MTAWKRLDLLIDAFASVRRRHDARMLVVGEGPERAYAAERIRHLGLSDDAEAVGWVITTDAHGGGPNFVTENGKYGLLVPRGDPDKLADAMARMLRNDVRARYSKLGLQRVEALSPIASANALIDFVNVRPLRA
jgi:glycosyltransferase involved in cell wall biosynthesis